MDKDSFYRAWGKVVCFFVIFSFLQTLFNAFVIGGWDILYLASKTSFWMYVGLDIILHIPILVPLLYFSFKKD